MLAQSKIKYMNRRQRSRSTTFKHAKIMFNGDSCVYDALLKNVSAYGANLDVACTESVPEDFNLYLVQDDFSVKCKVKWRHSNCIGVEF